MNFTIGKRIKDFFRKRFQIFIVPFKKIFKKEELRNYSEAFDKENVVRTYYDNGQLKSIAYVENGKYEGICTTFDEDGYIISQENYKKGQLDGTCIYYYPKIEKVEYEKFFFKGILVNYKKFDKNGNIIESKELHKL